MLLGADRQEVPVTIYPGQDLVEADLSDIPDVYQDLYWHAPKTYLGDKVRDGQPPHWLTDWTVAVSSLYTEDTVTSCYVAINTLFLERVIGKFPEVFFHEKDTNKVQQSFVWLALSF